MLLEALERREIEVRHLSIASRHMIEIIRALTRRCRWPACWDARRAACSARGWSRPRAPLPRVEDVEQVSEELRSLLPGIDLRVAHGQQLLATRSGKQLFNHAIGVVPSIRAVEQEGAALALLTAVQRAFRKLGMAFDFALVSLELGEVLLRQGRYDVVQALALEMEWIFDREGIHLEAEKALRLFRRAAEARSATPELAGQVVRYLYQAQHDPEARFAA